LWRAAAAHRRGRCSIEPRSGSDPGGLTPNGVCLTFTRSGYDDGTVRGWGLALTLVAFAALSLGGWLGGALVFRHGMRVEEDAAESTQDAGVTHRTRTHGA
jgi:hypothetical protein